MSKRLWSGFWIFGVMSGTLVAENWPQFRGPRGDGTSMEKQVVLKWSPTENIAWKAPLPGEGHSSPAVWEDAIFLTSVIKETGERLLYRLEAKTGKIVWKKSLFTAPVEAMHRENSSASSSPVTDGTFVYTSFQNKDRVDLRCFDFNGKEIWAIQPLLFTGEHGYSYSPVIYKDILLFDCRQEGEAAFLGLNKKTGQVLWRQEPGKKRISHIPPLLVDQGGRTQVVVSGSNETKSYDPQTGKLIWSAVGPSDVSVAGLAFGDGMVFTSAGYPTRTRMAIKVDGSGDVTSSKVAWSLKRQVTYVPAPVFYQGHLFTVIDEGMLVCLNAQTGEPTWEERTNGRYRSSLVLVNGNILATNDQGVTTVFAADSQKYRPIATNDLKDFCYATPAISNGRIYLRTGSSLFCIASP